MGDYSKFKSHCHSPAWPGPVLGRGLWAQLVTLPPGLCPNKDTGFQGPLEYRASVQYWPGLSGRLFPEDSQTQLVPPFLVSVSTTFVSFRWEWLHWISGDWKQWQKEGVSVPCGHVPCASQRRELGLTRLCRLSHSPPRGEATSGKPFSSNLSILCLAWTPASPNLVLNILKAIFVINKDILLLFSH